jgi:hypothetical protein
VEVDFAIVAGLEAVKLEYFAGKIVKFTQAVVRQVRQAESARKELVR